MYVSDEKPGVGTYMCTMCYLELIITCDNKKLPECPDCKARLFKKVD